MKKPIEIPGVISYRVSEDDRELLAGLVKKLKPKSMASLVRLALEQLRDRQTADRADVLAIRDHLAKTIGEPTEFQIMRFALQCARRELEQTKK